MGSLERLDRRCLLRPRTRVGRYRENELVLDETHVSSHHAVLEWGGEGNWIVKDLGSTNGTFVDGTLLSPGGNRALVIGSKLAFGDPDFVWTLVDAARPPAEAIDASTGDRITAEHEMLVLGTETARAVVLEDRPGSWVLEFAGETTPARDGQDIEVAGRRWSLRLPVTLPSTARIQTARDDESSGPLGGAHLSFFVSTDLEHVMMKVSRSGTAWTTERTYVRLLVELAKQRLADASRADLRVDDRGWMYSDELCERASIDDESRLNIEIHRARKDMAKHGLPSPASVVQRRRGTKQLRVGTDDVSVEAPG